MTFGGLWFVAFSVLPFCISGADTKLPPSAARTIDFEKEVRPIFEVSCYECHGANRQRSGYRLDVRQVALHGGDASAPNIVPGDSSQSPLIHFVAGLEDDMLMPSKGDPLTPEQIGVLRAWIDQGALWPDDGSDHGITAAAWKEHWSFQPLVRPVVPVLAAAQMGNPVDAFIRIKLDELGLAPSPAADRRTLIRRLSFDLTGLPPTPEEVSAFIADDRPAAYERWVERLLASPRYGERWARHWLDVVKFAESDGFERNNIRPNAWPYRDYVIRAFNEDKPYDQFIKEQLAGDALGVDEATGLLVGGSFDALQSFEPPLFNLGQRADELYEMVGTAGSAFLGMTIGCARCHDHKFDPISHADYYAWVAVFQGVEHGERPMRPRKFEQLLASLAGPRERVAEIDRQLLPYRPLARDQRVFVLNPVEKPVPHAGKPLAAGAALTKSGTVARYTEGTELGQAGDLGNEMRLPTLNAEYRSWTLAEDAALAVQPWGAMPAGRYRVWLSWSTSENHVGARYVLDADGNLATTQDQTEIAHVEQATFADGRPAVAGERRWSGFFDAGIHQLGAPSRFLLARVAPVGLVTADAILLEEVAEQGRPGRNALPHLRAPVVVKANEDRFPPVEAKFLRFTVLASNTPEGYLDELEVFAAEPTPRNVAVAERGGKATSPTVDGHDGNPFYVNDGRFNERAAWNSPAQGPGHVQIEFAQRERIDRIVWSRNRSSRAPKLDDHLVTEYEVDVSLDGREWRRVASSRDRLGQEYRLATPVLPTLSTVPRKQAEKIERLATERRALQQDISRQFDFPPVYAGSMREPGPTFRFNRGDPLSPREQVAPGGLSRIGGTLQLAPDTPEQQRRLALAAAIADPQHPLTARVMVNRIWHYHFGTGLVDTPSDFGMNGSKPTHPELLDWLASEFIVRGWRIKDLHRLILTSETYRQSSRPHAKGLEADAAARYLWRYPPRRMEAEALRDAILALSGRLDERAGGPGFFLFKADVNRSSVQVYESKSEFEDADFRRMVYQLKPRAQLDDVFGAFDCPDAGQIAPNRTRSTTPLQAFNLLNSPFVMQQAAALATRLVRDAGPDAAAQTKRAFHLAFGRDPTLEESRRAIAMIKENDLTLFCRVMLNTNEFITLH